MRAPSRKMRPVRSNARNTHNNGVVMRRLGIACLILAAVSVGYVRGAQVERASAIRIAPVDEAAMTQAQREMLGPSGTGPQTLQLFRICVRAPEMCRGWVAVTQSFAKLSMSLHDR